MASKNEAQSAFCYIFNIKSTNKKFESDLNKPKNTGLWCRSMVNQLIDIQCDIVIDTSNNRKLHSLNFPPLNANMIFNIATDLEYVIKRINYLEDACKNIKRGEPYEDEMIQNETQISYDTDEVCLIEGIYNYDWTYSNQR